YQHLGRKEDANKAYRRAVEQAEAEVALLPSNARTVARLAVYQAKAGDDNGAQATIKRALSLAPNDEQVLQRAAVVHALGRRTALALDSAEMAIAKGYDRRLMAEEEDLVTLRSMPRFAAIISTPEVKR